MSTKSVIVLNADYTFLSTISWQDAICLLYKGSAKPVESFKDSKAMEIVKRVRSVSCEIVVPAIIRLIKHVRAVFRKEVPWSKRHVYLRDDYTCQYTGRKLKPSEASIDHVVPRSRGGATSFTNCVTCCKDINHKKGDKTPQEAGLTLLRRPTQPTINEFLTQSLKQQGLREVMQEFGLI